MGILKFNRFHGLFLGIVLNEEPLYETIHPALNTIYYKLWTVHYSNNKYKLSQKSMLSIYNIVNLNKIQKIWPLRCRLLHLYEQTLIVK